MKCYYPRCDFEGTQEEIDDHLAYLGTDPDHDWPAPVGPDPRLDKLGKLSDQRLDARLAATRAGRVVHLVVDQGDLPAWSLCGVRVERPVTEQAVVQSPYLRRCDECLQRHEPEQ